MRNGFSLVELSIVLVILGLLTGGILAGQSLIRAAELRSVVTEYQRFHTATMTFRDKYFAFPGDMRNAEDFWGSMSSGTCPNATGGTGTQTCNGDGDGEVDLGAAVSQTGEDFLFWQHLANAGLIEGSYTGIAGSLSRFEHIAGENSPISRISNAGWGIHPNGDYTGINNTIIFAANMGNNMTLGSRTTASMYDSPAFSAGEVWNIDKKVDDGKPGTGRLMIRYWDVCTDADTNGHTNVSDRTTANYLLSNNSVQCAIHFPNFF